MEGKGMVEKPSRAGNGSLNMSRRINIGTADDPYFIGYVDFLMAWRYFKPEDFGGR